MRDFLRPQHALALAALPLAFAACSTVVTNNAPGGSADAGLDAAVDDDGAADAGHDASDPIDPTYPAAHTAIPPVDFNGGRVLTAPKIVTVTFGADSQRALVEQLGDTLTSSTWWDAVRAGYCAPQASANCVGKGTGGGHVNFPTTGLPTSFTDSARGGPSTIQEFLQQHINDGSLPAPTDQTIYAVYLPAGVSITVDADASCQVFLGYHNTLSVTPEAGAAIPVAYTIVPRCNSSTTNTTLSASHELIEAATDPDVGLNSVGYYMLNRTWAFGGGEVGDLCVDVTNAGGDHYNESGLIVQRSWSNASAKAGHDPCVPIPPDQVFFGAAPGAKQQEISLAVGASTTIELTAFSDAPMADWTLSAVDFGQYLGTGSHLGFSFDKTTVHNGSKVQLTVTLKSAPGQGGAQLYGILATSGAQRHFWPAAVIRK